MTFEAFNKTWEQIIGVVPTYARWIYTGFVPVIYGIFWTILLLLLIWIIFALPVSAINSINDAVNKSCVEEKTLITNKVTNKYTTKIGRSKRK